MKLKLSIFLFMGFVIGIMMDRFLISGGDTTVHLKRFSIDVSQNKINKLNSILENFDDNWIVIVLPDGSEVKVSFFSRNCLFSPKQQLIDSVCKIIRDEINNDTSQPPNPPSPSEQE